MGRYRDPGRTASSLGQTVEIIAIMSLQCSGGWHAANQPRPVIGQASPIVAIKNISGFLIMTFPPFYEGVVCIVLFLVG
jgi:hypothetical protein